MASNFTKRGIARYPKTDKAYTFDKASQRSVPDPDGKFSLEVIFEGNDADNVIALVKETAKEAGLKLANVKNWPFKPEIDSETDEETGRTIIKFSQSGKDKYGEAKTIRHFDARVRPLPKSFKLTSGSEVIVAYRPRAFKELGGGVSLYLDSVQVTKFVEAQAANPGFEAQEDGFEYEADEAEDPGFRSEEPDEASPTDF
jgi:hypothetical protein